ncbi:Rieske (2Fe-2S) protein [Pseudonocardia eucalypti]|uniref:Rieske (2Fe-2S) protein n=1 Tax=Pseudonocardia eucalypti TaxID=648755 RepID=A0ABP9QQZ1_9PSEU|nr:nitrite reductase/ring-hydroxylating ferredoxin subunit [Pseudonocardia eucalypti]
MSERGVRRFVADLLRGRRPRRFRVEESEVAELRTAIVLRAARPGGAAPREEFVTDLRRRLAQELGSGEPAESGRVEAGSAARPDGSEDDATPKDQEPTPGPVTPIGHSRRRVVQAASLAAGAAAIGAGADHVLGSSGPDGAQETLAPNSGRWRTVVASADLPEGGVHDFDLGNVTGFVARSAGRLAAVSGVCTHLGCRLAFNPQARRLDCPCHNASFALGGQLLRYQLAVAPRPLPLFQVREVDGMVQVFAPDTAT